MVPSSFTHTHTHTRYKAWFKDYAAGTGMVHLFPHWNWVASMASTASTADTLDGDTQEGGQGHLVPCTGVCRSGEDNATTVDVWAFSNGAEVELFVNGAR